MKEINIGISDEMKITVSEKDLATVHGSGNLPVYATPALISHFENLAMNMIKPFIENTESSVGISINANHLKASAINETIFIEAEITDVKKNIISFYLTAKNTKGNIIGNATHSRAIINIEKFMSNIKP